MSEITKIANRSSGDVIFNGFPTIRKICNIIPYSQHIISYHTIITNYCYGRVWEGRFLCTTSHPRKKCGQLMGPTLLFFFRGLLGYAKSKPNFFFYSGGWTNEGHSRGTIARMRYCTSTVLVITSCTCIPRVLIGTIQ